MDIDSVKIAHQSCEPKNNVNKNKVIVKNKHFIVNLITQSILAATASVFMLPAIAADNATPPDFLQIKVKDIPLITDIKNSAIDGWQIAKDKWDKKAESIINNNQYIFDQDLVRSHYDKKTQSLDVSNKSYSLQNRINSVQVSLNDNSIAIGNTVEGSMTDPNAPTKMYKGFLALRSDAIAYDTTVNNNASISLSNRSKAYNTIVNKGGEMHVGAESYAQATLIDGGYLEQKVMSKNTIKDTIVINGGEHRVYGGTAINTHVGKDSFQMVSGLAQDTVLYDGAFQQLYSGSGENSVVDNNTTVLAGARQQITVGISENAKIYGTQVLSGVDGKWENGNWNSDDKFRVKGQTTKDATIYAGGIQLIQSGNAEDTHVYGTQIISGKKGGWVDGNWVEQDNWIGHDQVANNSIIHQGGIQVIEYYADATNTLIDGGAQIVKELGHIENTTIDNGGESTIAFGAYSNGKLDVNNGSLTLQGGDNHSWTESLGKGAFASQVNLVGDKSALYLQHNADTTNSEATILSLTNNGTVFFGRKDGSDTGKYSRLQISKLTGSGYFVMNTNLEGSQGDFLNISDSIEGKFNVKVMDSGHELKRNTAGVNPYHLIFANGSDSENFALVNGSVDLGAYKYYLVQGEQNDSDNWYLSPQAKPTEPEPKPDPDPKPEISETGKNAIALANVTPTIWSAELSTLRSRLGDLRDNLTTENGIWTKYITSRHRISTENVGYKQDMNGIMLGGDHSIDLEKSKLLIGALVSYTHSQIDASSSDGKVNSYALGVYSTWLHEDGYYMDGVIKANHFRTENSATFNAGKTTAKDNTNGIGLSIEAGKHINIDSYFVEPYLLASAFHSAKTGYRFDNGMKVNADSVGSLKAEAGTTLGKSFIMENGAIIKPYIRLAVSHEFKKNNDIYLNDTEKFSNDMSGTVGKYGVGLTTKLDNNWSAYAEFNYAKGSREEMPYSGYLGVHYNF